MEEEARDILRSALAVTEPKENLAAAIRRRVEAIGGMDIELPARSPMREPIDFGE
jgi:plasmid stability protein